MRITGWVMIAVLVFIALVTFGSEAEVIDESSDPALAAIHVYIAGVFWAMIVIGIGIAVYIMKSHVGSSKHE